MSEDIPLRNIAPDPEQPRKDFDETKIEELAQSMAQQGQAVPITVRPASKRLAGGDRTKDYVIVAGERRWRAAQHLGWDRIRAEVREASVEESRWLALIENLQREALSPMEEARALRHLLRQDGITQTELAKRIGKDQSYVSQKLRLLKVPPPVSFWVEEGLLSEAHVRQLMRIEGFYLCGATITYKEELEKSLEDSSQAHQLFLQERPTNQIRCFPRFEEADQRKHLQPAADCFLNYVREQGHTVDAWVVAAWHHGGAAYTGEMSVSELSGTIDELELLVRGHYVCLGDHWMRDEEPFPPSVKFEPSSLGIAPLWRGGEKSVSDLTCAEVLRGLQFIQYWGAGGDLDHAGLLSALRSTCRSQGEEGQGGDMDQSQIRANWALIEESRDQVGGISRPTEAMNEDAPDGIAWRQLENRLSELGISIPRN
ncbi:ParB/RepB/Spo0J family partition protein [Salinibacter ruber]|uniref:ParB/RepB/Spo0J family partition protein n=1 Tax=Salinibacter ruber TaxID=146919 RepID=UPI0020748C63|nr:ParB/RepB/Spo0J family partition protein [Salinibacter ruber]